MKRRKGRSRGFLPRLDLEGSSAGIVNIPWGLPLQKREGVFLSPNPCSWCIAIEEGRILLPGKGNIRGSSYSNFHYLWFKFFGIGDVRWDDSGSSLIGPPFTNIKWTRFFVSSRYHSLYYRREKQRQAHWSNAGYCKESPHPPYHPLRPPL